MTIRKTMGFTLVELLITIVAVSVVLALGVPSFVEFIKNNRLATQTNSLIISIQLARSEAVKRGTGAVICASADQATCSGSDDWATGWIVFSDIGQDGNVDLGGGDCQVDDCIVRNGDTIQHATLDGGGTDTISFLPDGRTPNAVTIRLTADECKRRQVRDISVTTQGHTIVTIQDCP